MKKGFTLIELLVVIAIIGILSGIVLTSLGTARNKAKDATVESQLSSMRSAAEIYASSNSDKYGTASDCTTGMFIDTNSNMKKLVSSTSGIVCGSTDNAWAAAAPLVSDATKYFCVDYTGKAAMWAGASAPAAGLTACQ